MKTFILKWRPRISNYKFSEFSYNLQNIDYLEFNWQVDEYEKAKAGDRFYMLVTGTKREGVVMKGYFISDPYEDADWAGRDRAVHYVRMDVQVMIDPRRCPILLTSELSNAMPKFDWNHCRCGSELPEEYIDVMESMWDEYFENNEDIFDWKNANHRFIPFTIDDALLIASDVHENHLDIYGNSVFLHVYKMGILGKNREEKICGYLHEFLDCEGYSVEDLVEMHCPERIIKTLELLKYDKDMPYLDYIRKIGESGNKTAIAVKCNDLYDTLSLDKDAGNLEQMRMHAEAIQLLASYK